MGSPGEHPLSEYERTDRVDASRPITAEDIRALAGPATPHFSLQIRNRIARLIEALPEGDPVRLVGEREIDRLTEISKHSGELRGAGSRRHL